MRGSDVLEKSMETRNLEVDVIKEEETTIFRINIREINYIYAFPEPPMLDPEMLEKYKDKLKVRVYIKAFTCFNNREPSEKNVDGG